MSDATHCIWELCPNYDIPLYTGKHKADGWFWKGNLKDVNRGNEATLRNGAQNSEGVNIVYVEGEVA